MKKKRIERTLHYYELGFDYHKDFTAKDGDLFREVFRIIIKLAKTRAKIRYQQFGEKAIFIQGVKFRPIDKQITGMMRCVRMDLLPEIMNIETDEARGIEAKVNEGLVETTHFLIDYSKKKPKLVIEYNQFGAKILDFIQYILNIGKNKKALINVYHFPIIKDELKSFKSRMNRCSEFHVKIHKDHIDEIKSMDIGLFRAMEYSISEFNNEYATLTLKFDYQNSSTTNKIKGVINKIIDRLNRRKKDVELFDQLRVKAEDAEQNNKLEVFDLLVNKVKSVVKVEKKERYRTVVSEDIFEKMKSELIRKRI